MPQPLVLEIRGVSVSDIGERRPGRAAIKRQKGGLRRRHMGETPLPQPTGAHQRDGVELDPLRKDGTLL